MLEVKAVIVSESPILMDRMDEKTLESLRTGVRLQGIKDRPAEGQAEPKIYRDEDGNVGVPVENLFACLVIAGRSVKNGKKQISTATTTTLPALMTIKDTFLVFNGHADKKWIVDKRRGRLPHDGTAVCLVRPRFNKWGFDVTLEVNDKEVSEDTIKQLFRVAGTSVGLCGFRPACRGPFGRFTIKEWKSKKVS